METNKEIELAKDLINFIEESPTAFHAVSEAKKLLEANGFKELKEEEQWVIKENSKYFTIKNNSAMIAFEIGNGKIRKKGFKIVGAHTDTPCFRIKPNAEIIKENSYLKLNTEVYGGPILNTWFDRTLSLAGRVILKGENIMEPKISFINIKRPLMVIPNLAIHMNREVNKGIEINPQNDTLPLLTMVNEELEKENVLLRLIAHELKVDYKEILDFDIFLYEYEKGSIIGLQNEFISSSRLDDLEAVHAGLKALLESGVNEGVNVLALFDNEEIGSATKQGADSNLLSNTLERIVYSLGGNRAEFFRALANSFMISADGAHAVHPNNVDKSDPTSRPIINKGPALKVSANQKYTSDSYSSSILIQICEKAEIPMQKFVNRSDERGGSTIGPISSTHLNLNAVDIGIPMLAMHSIREMVGVKDHYYMYNLLKEFYSL
ncbi:M18 family aminopeptidase [Clostridium grantii]|uniref:M18 family aminopeptidase n=1 Tax=Clostridium grantii DSM 8605 TaxID=1121316 RepID=A0A1M5RTF2_9CLOT|nr:M18 family aminopeptidase [Clostridium grantii]SHH29431.1 aspartyl aminopeptidase [Clostridium grantii DSM 8605]